jgi:hypothetical protein
VPAPGAHQEPHALVEREREVTDGAGAYGPAPVASHRRRVTEAVRHNADATLLLQTPTARFEQGRAEGGPGASHVYDAHGRPFLRQPRREFPNPISPTVQPEGREGREAEDSCAFDAATLESHLPDVDGQPFVARFSPVGLVGLVHDADCPEARKRQERRRARPHQYVHLPCADGLVDGRPVPTKTAVIRRNRATGGKSSAQVVHQALHLPYLRRQYQGLPPFPDGSACHGCDRFRLLPGGRPPQPSSTALDHALNSARERF